MEQAICSDVSCPLGCLYCHFTSISTSLLYFAASQPTVQPFNSTLIPLQPERQIILQSRPTTVPQVTVLQTATQNKKNLNSLNGASKDRKNTIMPNSATNTVTSILIQHYQKEELTFDCYDIESLKAMLLLRQKSYIDNKGQITNQGIAKSLMTLLDLKRLDVLALAFVASKPVNASRDEFLNLSLEFNVKRKNVYNIFNRLCKTKLISNLGLAVFEVSNAGKRSLHKHMPALYRINLNRDELFKTQH